MNEQGTQARRHEGTKPRGGDDADCEIVSERLRVLSDVLDMMRAVVPTTHGCGTGEKSRAIAKAHDQMVTEFIVWASHWIGPLNMDFPVNRYRPPGCIDLVAMWRPKGTADTAVAHGPTEREEWEGMSR